MILSWILMPLFFIVTSGALRWWEAWAYCALMLVPMTVFVLLMARTDPEFLEWRMKGKEKERIQQRVVSGVTVLFLALYVLSGLDRRFGWSKLPLAAVVAAQALVFASYLGILRVFVENRWAGRTVETRPGQQVISTGPYALVRHPMYAAALVLTLASPIALGSAWALIPAVLSVPVLVVRILNEEAVLTRELAGYEAYRQRVRYRLLPGIW